MLINCIVIDDEPLAISKLEGFIEKIPELKLIRTFSSAVEAIGWLKQHKTDLIFLDIQMAQLTGIEFLEVTGPLSKVIITTAYDKFAIKGFELNVADYLLKPFSFQRFLLAVSKVIDLLSVKSRKDNSSAENSFMFVKTEYRLERVDFESILYIEGMKDYLRIVCNDKKIMTLQNFANIEDMLPAKGFCRVHKSFIVAIDKIESIERGVIKIGGQRIPVTITYKDDLFNQIKNK
jgi:two-component system LytT family response regulator